MVATMTPKKSSTTQLTLAQRRQEEARRAYRDSLAANLPLTGAKLGEMFELSERWGQDRIAEVKEAARTSSPIALIPTEPMGLPPMTPPNAETATRDEVAPESGSRLGAWKQKRATRRAAKVMRKPQQAPALERPKKPAQQRTNPQRPGASGVAWLAFGLGILISIAANIGHVYFVTDPADHVARIASMSMAALWPVLLAVAVEVVSRVSYPRGWRWWLPGYAATILVGVAAAIISYQHMNGLLLSFGESEVTGILGPIAVDGTLVVGGFAILAIGETRKKSA